jgi:class 3 adenylate cyclase
MDFNVIVETVNAASCFSGLAQGRQIPATRSARDHLGSDFEVRQLPSAKVKGKAEEVEAFEVVY